jgi:hypothetical protein
MKPTKHEYTILKQIYNHIPAHLVQNLPELSEWTRRHDHFHHGVRYKNS